MKNTTSAAAHLIHTSPVIISDDELLVAEHFTISTDMIIKSQLLELLAFNGGTPESTACCAGIE